MFLPLSHKFSKQAVIIAIATIFAFGAVFGTYLYTTNAFCVSPWGMLCFGGPIEKIQVCCNGLEIDVGQPRDGSFLITAGTDINMFYNVYTPGVCVKGDAYPGGVCIEPFSWPPCSSAHSVDGIVRQIGDSLALNYCQVESPWVSGPLPASNGNSVISNTGTSADGNALGSF